MSSNITAPQDGQRFSFTKQGSIDQPGFSSVTVLPMTGTATSTPTHTTSKTASSSSGLSIGAKAGIGAGVAALAIIALLARGTLLLRRRKRRSQSPSSSPLTSDQFNERKSIIQPAAQELSSFSDVHGDAVVDGNRLPQELDPATAAMYEMEAGKERERKGRSVSPYKPGFGREQKAIMQQGFFRENITHEMDALQRPLERSELPGEEGRER